MYAFPIVIIRGQAYVGGKTIDNRQGNVTDYLYRNAITANALLVEIKTPTTDLVRQPAYRNNVFNVDPEVTAATVQVLANRASLIENFAELTRNDPGRFQNFSPRGLVVIGDLERAQLPPDAVRSFELFRNQVSGVDIVTFDELAEKVRQLLTLLVDN